MAEIKMWQMYKAVESDSDTIVQVYGMKDDRVLYLDQKTRVPNETSVDEFTKSFEVIKR